MGMPPSRWDALVREASIAARRRKRRRLQRRMLWLLTVVTSAALAVIAVLIMDIAKVPTTVRPAALSASAQTVSHGAHGAARSPAGKAKPRASKTPVAYPRVADVTSGLSYRQLSSPWQPGCPSDLTTPALDWTAGENTVAGHVSIGGSVIGWHALACSGPLAQQFSYTGPGDLEAVTANLLAAIDPAYYAGVQHSRSTDADKSTRVSGHQAWEIEFTMTYPDGAGQGVTWRTEPGAVVVVDRGQALAPAVFYVSVPATLGVPNVALLIGSLSLGPQS